MKKVKHEKQKKKQGSKASTKSSRQWPPANAQGPVLQTAGARRPLAAALPQPSHQEEEEKWNRKKNNPWWEDQNMAD